jgi:thioredoxin
VTSSPHPGDHAPPLVVACLCAAWCSSCREYRATFDGVARTFTQVRFLWVDVEDDAALLDGVEVENFPTLLIGRGGAARFFGPLTPHAEVLSRLVRAHVSQPGAAALPDPVLATLLARLLER